MPISPNSMLPCYDITIAPYSGNIQQAITDAMAHGGGTVYVPTGTYTITSSLTIPPNGLEAAGITLLGDGPSSTIIKTTTQQVILNIQASNILVEGITFQGAGTATGTPKEGIVIGDTVNNGAVRGIVLRRCIVASTGSYCLRVLSGPSLAYDCSYEDCRFHDNSTSGAVHLESGSTTQYFKGCSFYNFKGYGVAISATHGASFIDCIIEVAADNTQPYFYADQAVHTLLQNCWFEDTGSSSQWFLQIDRSCHAFSVLACTFRRNTGSDPHAIYVNSSTDACKGVLIINPEMLSSGAPTGTDHILVNTADHEVQLIGGLARTVGYTPTYPVRINDLSTKAMTFGGNNRVRLQRLTDAEILALAYAAKGQLVYNSTTNRIDVYTDIGWVGIATGIR